MRRFLISALAATLLALASFGSALGHVHGVTPLPCNTHDNANSGGNGTNGTAADDANGGPITGVIPFGVGNAEGKLGDGGRHSSLCDE
jgi:hypothetical protein